MSGEKNITFKIVEHLGVLDEYQTGWRKELNLVSWNNNPAKYDIRDWDMEHERMSRGITLTEEQAFKLAEFIKVQQEMKVFEGIC